MKRKSVREMGNEKTRINGKKNVNNVNEEANNERTVLTLIDGVR